MRRAKLLVDLCQPGPSNWQRKYAIVKVLELDSFHLLPYDEVRPSSDKDISIIKLNKIEYHVIVVCTGEKPALNVQLRKLIRYENIYKKYRSLSCLSKYVQTNEETGECFDVEAAAKTSSLPEMQIDVTNATERNLTGLSAVVQNMQLFTAIESEPLEILNKDVSSAVDVPQEKGIPEMGWKSVAVDEGNEKNIQPKRNPEENYPEYITLSPRQRADAEQESDSSQDYNIIAKPMENLEEQSDLPEYTDPLQESSSASNIKSKKTYFCIYCKRQFSNLPRHLEMKHNEEDRVKQFIDLPKKDKRRMSMIGSIRREGIMISNEILKRKGQQVLLRKGITEKNSLPCPKCELLYKKSTLSRHYKMCSGKARAPKNIQWIAEGLKKKKTTSTSAFCDSLTEIVLPGMLPDQTTETIHNDAIILEYGSMLCLRHASEIEKQKNMIRARMRAVAKLKMIIQTKDNSVKQLDDVFHPDKWGTFIQAVKHYGHMYKGNVTEKSPNNVTHVGLAMVNIAKDTKAVCAVNEEGMAKRNLLQAWIDLYGRKFTATIGRNAAKVAAQKKWEKKSLVPIAEDVLKLNNYLKKEIEDSLTSLDSKFTMKAFESLNKATMVQLLSFNRKRIGEVQYLLKEDFVRKAKLNEESDAFKNLYESEKMLAKHFYHVNVKGKWHRAVPLLISEIQAKAIDKILEVRTLAGIPEQNPFMFGKGENDHYNASIAMREAAYECKAAHPENLTGTQLRKHVATAAQALNLTENDLRVLSGFLGHTVQTHLEHYRMPSEAIHAARISRLLLALDSGKISEFKGKSLNEIDVEIPMQQSEASTPKSTSMPTAKKSSPNKQHMSPNKMQLSPRKKNLSPQKKLQSPFSTPTKGLHTDIPSPRKRQRVRWTAEEKQVMKRSFDNHLRNGTLPSFTECYNVKLSAPELNARRVPVIKAWVFNEINRRKKMKYDSDSE